MGRTLTHSTSLPPHSSPAVQAARDLLLAAAPRAAAVLLSGLEDDASKEQIDSARDVLDRVGLRKDAPPAETPVDSAISEVAFGAFKALLSHFGLEIPVAPPAIPAQFTPARSVEALLAHEALLPPSEEAEIGPPSGARRAGKKKKSRKSNDSNDFFLSLEEKETSSEGILPDRPAKADAAVDGGGLA